MLRKFTLAASLFVLMGLTACGGVDVGSDEDKANLEELERRGFTDPTQAYGGDFASNPQYDAGIGNCRITLVKGNAYWGWTYDDTLRDVDVTKLKESGLLSEACFE